MSNLIEEAKASIDGLIEQAYNKAAATGALPEGGLPQGKVEIPKDSQNGDYAANHAMSGAKAMKLPPRKIAEALVASMDLSGSYFGAAEIAGPGFLNLRLSDKWYGKVLESVQGEGKDFGRSNEGKNERVMVEFVSANPTGPMTIGNARGGVLGDALASVMDRAGYDVYREFYVNDAGNQVDLFGKSIEARYLQLINGEDSVEFPENGYH
ncbi:MAG: arginine--tRNA ligase, partial [Oscillospiraceae bacterium]